MLVTIITVAYAILLLTTCNSIEVNFLNSVNRSVSSTEKRDFYFLCITCDGSLAWSEGSGYTSNSNVRMVRFGKDSSEVNVVYLSMLLDKTETCLTSVFLVHQDDISRVECRSTSARKNITVFETDSEYPSMSDGNTYLKLVYSGEIVFSGVFNYTYIFMCEEQGGQSLSWLIDGHLVKELTTHDDLGTPMLRPHDDNMFSDAFLVTNYGSSGSMLTSVLLVSVKSRSQSFNVVCQVDGNQEEVDIDLPLQFSPTEDSDLNITSEKSFFKIDSSPTTDTTDEIDSTSKLYGQTISTGNSNSTISIVGLSVGICVGITAIVIIIFVSMGIWICKNRNPRQVGRFQREAAEKSIEEVELDLNSSNAVMLPEDAAINRVNEAGHVDDVHKADDSDRDEVDGPRNMQHPVEEKNESSPGVRGIWPRKRMK